jgi:hypothetical protein
VPFGSSAKTSDFLVDPRTAWWQGLRAQDQRAIERVPLKMATGPESRGVRTQVLPRRVQLVDPIGKPLQLLDSPPYHRKDNPSERWWGMLDLPGQGTQLRTVDTRLEWANRMPCKGSKPVVELRRRVYAKGVTLGKTAMQAVEARLERNSLFPKWAILMHPASAT